MWTRAIAGIVMCAVGGLWIAQGVGVAKGSFMTGDATYTFLGAVVAVLGIGLLVSARRARNRRTPTD
jgi:uncharacterized membrane protein HdeD (DUF308 family)